MRDSSGGRRPFPALRLLLAGAAACAAGQLLRAQDEWFRIRTPHFSILSSGSEWQARTWALDLEQFTAAMQAGFPGRHDLPPVTVVIFKRDADFRPYKPLDRGQPAAVSGLFARTAYSDVIGLDGEATGIDVHHTILHEAVHWFFSNRPRPLPIWAEEGIAEVYSTLRMTDQTHAVIGDPIPGHLQLLRRGLGIPLPQVFRTNRATLHYNEVDRTGYFYAESWLVAHYALFGARSDRGLALDRYLALLNAGRGEDDAFAESFGSDAAGFQVRLQRYLVDGSYRSGLITLPQAVWPDRFVLDRPTRADRELALGGLLIVTRTPADAAPHLLAAAREAPADPGAWEELGAIALNDHDLAGAATNFRRAVNAGSRNYLVDFHLATIELRPDAPAAARSATAPPGDDARELLRTAISLRPDFLPAYENLAAAIYGEEPLDPRDPGLIAAGRRVDPADPILALGAAAAQIRGGDRAEGRRELADLLAHLPPTASPRVPALGRLILKAEAFRDLNRQIAQLAADYRYAAVAALVDNALASGMELDAAERQRLTQVRDRAHGLQQLADAQHALTEGDRSRARALLEQLAGDPGTLPDMRAKAKAQLERLAAPAAQPGGDPTAQ